MHSYYRRHTLRARSSSNPPPPKEFGRRPRYEDRNMNMNMNESMGEPNYYMRGPRPGRLPYHLTREYEEQQGNIDRPQTPIVQRSTSRLKPPYIVTERQRAIWLSYYPDYEDPDSQEPNTSDEVAKTSADDETKDEE